MSRNFDVIIVVPADTDEHGNAFKITAVIDAYDGTIIINQPAVDPNDEDDTIVLTRKQAIQLRDGLHHLLGDC